MTWKMRRSMAVERLADIGDGPGMGPRSPYVIVEKRQ